MDPMLLRIFQRHVAEQCGNVLAAANGIDDALVTSASLNADLDRAHEQFKRDRGTDPQALNRWFDFQAQQRGVEDHASEHLWRSIQDFAVATGNLSKLLWGQGSKYTKEREPLRRSIGVDDASPLRGKPPTNMRNNFEHFDERLETWWAEDPNHVFIDRITQPFSIAGVDSDKSFFRGFDPATGELGFWGETFNLWDVVREVQRIVPTVSAEAAKPHWEP